MNKKTCYLLTALLLAPVAAFAAKGDGPKAKAMAKYDLNHDGKLDETEIAALQKDFAAAPTGDLARFDTDKDGKLSAEELAKIIPGSGKKSDKGEKSGAKKKEAKTDDVAKDVTKDAAKDTAEKK